MQPPSARPIRSRACCASRATHRRSGGQTCAAPSILALHRVSRHVIGLEIGGRERGAPEQMRAGQFRAAKRHRDLDVRIRWRVLYPGRPLGRRTGATRDDGVGGLGRCLGRSLGHLLADVFAFFFIFVVLVLDFAFDAIRSPSSTCP